MGFIVAPAIFGMQVQSKNFVQHFHVIFDGINSIVSRGLHAADRSVIRTDNSRGIPEGIGHQGCVGGVSLHQI